MSIVPRFAPPGSVLAKRQHEARQRTPETAAPAGPASETTAAESTTRGFSQKLRDLRASFQETAAVDSFGRQAAAVRSGMPAGQGGARSLGSGGGPTREVTKSRSGASFDESQLELIHADSRIVIGEAVAGSGKTTSAIGFADARPDKRMLYMCFGRENALEAQRRFGKGGNVSARTGHSLAFGAVGYLYKGRLAENWRPREIAAALGIDNRLAACVGRALSAFYASVETEIGPSHLVALKDWGLSDTEQGLVIDHSRRAWRDMQDTSSSLPVVHDAYLKMWTLTKPRLDYDFLIVDEWQDTNPVVEELVARQLGHTRLLAIGDRHQSIYGFRGATNAMENLREVEGARIVTMPRTWRFGDRTANFANQVLQNLKGETISIQGMGKDGAWGNQTTLLTRTNAGLFEEAVTRQGEGMHWVGGIEKYNLEIIQDAYRIFRNQAHDARDPYMRRFTSWSEMEDYAHATRDAEIRSLLKLVDRHQDAIPGLLRKVMANALVEPAGADLQLTTAHRAKGMEHDCVRLGQDFEFLYDAEEEIRTTGRLSAATVQEVNLLYVGITRAKLIVALNDETQDWLAELPRLQRERTRAMARFHGSEVPRG